MLQKLTTVPALAAVLMILTAVLFVQNVELGLASNLPQKISDASSDLSSKQIFKPVPEVALAEAIIEPTETPVATPAPTNTPVALTAEAKVAELTIYKPTPAPVPEDVTGLIRKYAAEYGANAEVMIIIARCESGFRADAVSPSGAYKGLFQFVTSTWQSNRRAMGLSDDPALMLNAEEAIRTAAFKMGRDGYGAWPVCSQKAFSALALN